MKHRKHWYYLIYEECPVCGRGKPFRIRKYGKRPKRMSKRYTYRQVYDHCMGL